MGNNFRISHLKLKVKILWRLAYNYVRYDLKEIAFPSSLPNPPHFKKPRKLTFTEWFYVFKEASRIYAASWVRNVEPDLRKYSKNHEDGSSETTNMIEEKLSSNSEELRKKNEPSLFVELAVAARGGMETLRPVLQKVYVARSSAYRDALKSFVKGYQEGIHAVRSNEQELDVPPPPPKHP